MRTVKLTIEYDGTAYAGWQSQANARAIQDVLREAIGEMTDESVSLTGASRTDAGVHALAQTAVFKTKTAIPCEGFVKGLNSLLPKDIRIHQAEEEAESFHPIRNAKWKTYHYKLEIGERPSALNRHRIWWVGPRIDLKKMAAAARYLVGKHDFKSFQGAHSEVKTTVRTLRDICFLPGPILEFVGDGFLKQMVRNIVGTLVEIGTGKKQPQEVQKILEAKNRKTAGICAPPQGLYLVSIEY